MFKTDLDIIRSPEAEKMLQMVTEGFYDRSRIGLWMFEVIGREYDDMAEWARALRYEAFPQTCTWSIAIWEFVCGYEPDDTLSLDYRRRRILSKRLSRPPINPARIEAVLSTLTECPVYITENIAPYTFEVVVDNSENSISNYKGALQTLCKIKPSHLSFKIICKCELPEVLVTVWSYVNDPIYYTKIDWVLYFTVESQACTVNTDTYVSGVSLLSGLDWRKFFEAESDCSISARPFTLGVYRRTIVGE